MMDKKLMQKLKDKGVSSDVILDLILVEDEAPADAPAPQPEPKTSPAVPEEPKAPQPQQDPVLAAIEKLTGAIQASNILRDSTGSPKTETVEDILANMIAPPQEKGVK